MIYVNCTHVEVVSLPLPLYGSWGQNSGLHALVWAPVPVGFEGGQKWQSRTLASVDSVMCSLGGSLSRGPCSAVHSQGELLLQRGYSLGGSLEGC